MQKLRKAFKKNKKAASKPRSFHETNYHKNNELLVHGFIRKQCKKMNIKIPLAIIDLFFIWYHIKCIPLPFSLKYISSKRIALTENNYCATSKSGNDDTYGWVLADVEPVFKGIHCWRIRV